MKLWSLILALCTMVIIGCQKEFSSELAIVPTDAAWVASTPSTATNSARVHLNNLTPMPSSYSFNNATATTILLTDILIQIPTNCFVHLNNNPVVGTVNVKVTTATKFDEMLYHNLATVTSNNLLSTDGMVKIEATQNNNVLKLASGKAIDIAFKKSSSNNYQGFIGVVNNTVSNNITWNVNTNWQTQIDTAFFQGAVNLVTKINVDSLTWVNCDYFYNQPNPTNIYVKLPIGFGNSNTVCYGLIKADKVFFGLQGDAVNKQYWQGANYKVPMGKIIKLVAVCRKDNKNYYGTIDATIGSNTTVTISTMAELTDSDLQNRLSTL